MGEDALSWIEDYLKNRAYYVKIGAATSQWKTQVCGVPQGLVLGPLLYSTYMNEMTEAVRENDCIDESHKDNDDLFGKPCKICGELVMYADDATYHIVNKKREMNQLKLDRNVKKIQQFINNNELTMNIGKTTVTELMISQKKGRTKGDPPKLEVQTGPTTNKQILDKGTCKILGATFQSNLKWTIHLEKGKNSLFPSLRKLIGSLQHLGNKVPRKCRRILAASFIQSRMVYLMPLWGSSQNNLMRKAQSIWNRAARRASGLNRRTRTTKLMTENDWMNIREMTRFHSAVLLWKAVHTKSHRHMYRKLEITPDYRITVPEHRLQMTGRSLRIRAATEWNQMPDYLRKENSISRYKRTLKKWIKENRQQDLD